LIVGGGGDADGDIEGEEDGSSLLISVIFIADGSHPESPKSVSVADNRLRSFPATPFLNLREVVLLAELLVLRCRLPSTLARRDCCPASSASGAGVLDLDDALDDPEAFSSRSRSFIRFAAALTAFSRSASFARSACLRLWRL
jgi:hypothetical protein